MMQDRIRVTTKHNLPIDNVIMPLWGRKSFYQLLWKRGLPCLVCAHQSNLHVFLLQSRGKCDVPPAMSLLGVTIFAPFNINVERRCCCKCDRIQPDCKDLSSTT